MSAEPVHASSDAAPAGLVYWLPPEEVTRLFGVSEVELTRRVKAGEIQMRAKLAGGELVATLCSTDLMRCFGAPDRALRDVAKPVPAAAPNPFARPADSNRPRSLGSGEVKGARGPRGVAADRDREGQGAKRAASGEPPVVGSRSEPRDLEAPARTPAAVPLKPVRQLDPAALAREAAARAAAEAEAEAAHGRLVDAEERVRLLELHNARLEGRLETAGRVERGLQRYADKLEGKLEEAETLRLNLARAVGQLEAEVARLQGRLEVAEAEGPRLIEAPKREPRTARPKRRGWFGRRAK